MQIEVTFSFGDDIHIVQAAVDQLGFDRIQIVQSGAERMGAVLALSAALSKKLRARHKTKNPTCWNSKIREPNIANLTS